MKSLIFLRTALTILALAVVMLAALALIIWKTGNSGAAYFTDVKQAVIAMSAIAAGKSTVEHLANGGGLFGAAKALLTSAKPEGTPIASPAPPVAP